MVEHIKGINWTWGTNTLAAKHFTANILITYPPITPGEVIISKYLVNNVETNVISGASYNQWPVITKFTDLQTGEWEMEIWNYTNIKPAKQISERIY